jgi:predicted RND superfamily exporter protein
MTFSPSDAYCRLILDKPRTILLLLAILVFFFAWHSSNFRLDASSDSLTLENDQALKFYRAIEARYGSDDFLLITYTPTDDLFSVRVKQDLCELSDKLKAIQRVESVVTILDVPLIDSPPVTLSELQNKTLTLESPETNQKLARQELLNSPLYKNLLISSDGKMTAIQVNFKRDQIYLKLRERRNHLREKQLEDNLTASEKDELNVVSKQFDYYNAKLQKQEHNDIIQVRQIMSQYRKQAKLFLGGIPMITSDSIDFIRHDLMTFGLGVLLFLVVLLTLIFHQPRWIILPMITCGVAGLLMIGFLGWVDWPVTVVSSNFISLMLIITLSLMVHLIVRYRELQALYPSSNHHALIRQMIISKIHPGFYTAITSIVAFASLIISGIRPIIDFGWMMTIGISMSFVLAFTLFPAMLALLPPTTTKLKHDITGAITSFFARLIQRFDKAILLIFMLIAILSVAGISRLSVENRFIDYYKESTEIYQGMTLIDKKLGGTTPLDVIIDAPAEFFQADEETDLWYEESDPLFEGFELEMDEDGGITSTSYWFNSSMLPEINVIHEYLDSLPESGKVLSIDSSMQLLRSLDENQEMSDFFLSILYKRLPDNIKESLFTPYMSEDANQLRFSMRVYESDPSLKRDALLKKIRQHLTEELGLADEQVQLTGMLVLYNNLLQSLFKSQI